MISKISRRLLSVAENKSLCYTDTRNTDRKEFYFMNVKTGRAQPNALSIASLVLGVLAFAGVLSILLLSAAAAGGYMPLVWFACGGYIFLCKGFGGTAAALGLLSRGRLRMHGTALAGTVFGGAALFLCGFFFCILIGAFLIAAFYDPTFFFSIGGSR